MSHTLDFYFALLKTSMRATISKRGAFLTESMLMLFNNLIFLSMWWILFHKFQDIGGWGMHEMVVLMTVGMGAYGLMQICFGGVKYLSKTIISGDLDSFMTQPKNLLLYIAGSRSLSKGWGHLLTSLALIFIGQLTSPATLLLIFLSILCGCAVFTSIAIIAHSLVFWLGAIERLSKQYCDSLFLFALYPTNIYSGLMQVVMFTLVPAGIIGYLPVEIIRDFSWIKLIGMIASACFFLWLARTIFYLGLRRYESGNQFGVRA